MPSRITRLDEDVARKIAAGEVITRPAACVKELVDNSLDAGASRIEIKVKDGGKRSIVVVDDGCGMNAEDALLAFERHATSKIVEAEDLDSISTLGFRGEAMPSIAAVSKVELKTCEPGSIAGVNVRVEAGEIKKVKEVSCAPGTSIEISSLFYNIPARLKFMKSVSSEMGCIIDIITRYVLFYPTVNFRLEHNNHLIMQSPASGDPLEAAGVVLGSDAARSLLAVPPMGSSNLHAADVRGFVGKPSYNRSTNKNIYLAVNGRQIRSRVINRAVMEAFRDYMPPRRFPVAVLDLIVNPSKLDVNVHPQKEEIRFSNDQEIFQAVVAACASALDTAGIIPGSTIMAEKKSKEKMVESVSEPSSYPERTHSPNSIYLEQKLPEPALNPPVDFRTDSMQNILLPPLKEEHKDETGTVEDGHEMGRIALPEVSTEAENTVAATPGSMPRLRVIGQLKCSYLLCDGPEGLYIVDQHAAHERVVYERLLSEITDSVPATGLLFPITMSFSYSETVVIAQNTNLLARFGFGLERFGENEFIIKEIPAFLGEAAEKNAVEKVLDSLIANVYTQDVDQMRRELLVQTACHTAIRAGDPLSFKEMEALLEEMYRLKNPYNCPHGRPTIISITVEDLEREFKRR